MAAAAAVLLLGALLSLVPASAASAQSAPPEFTIHDVDSDVEISSLEFNSSSQYGGAAFKIKVDGPPRDCNQRRIPGSCHEALFIKAQTVTSRTWINTHGINQSLTLEKCPAGFRRTSLGGRYTCPGGTVNMTKPTCEWYVGVREAERAKRLRNDPNADVRAFDCESVVTVDQSPFRLQVDGKRGWWFVKRITPGNWNQPIRVDLSQVSDIGGTGSYDLKLGITQFHDRWFERTLPISHSPTSSNERPKAFTLVGPDDHHGPDDGAIVIGHSDKDEIEAQELRQGSQQQEGYVVDAELVAKVQVLAGQTQHGTAHVNRWNRVLVAFGAHDGTGVSGGAMTAAQAQVMADRHSSPVWDEVVAELTALEAAQQIPPPPPPTPEVSVIAGSGVGEGGDATFTVTATPVPNSNLDVSVTITQSGDFGAATGQRTVTINAGAASATLTVATTDDDADEADGSVTATVDAGSDYTVSVTQGAATVVVADDDAVPVGHTVDPAVVAKVQVLAGQTQHGTAHVNRWNRVLVAFGAHDGTGVSGGAMTAAQAQVMADRHSSPVWDEVVAELTALEAAR
ncbi:MAG: hypothetical protein OXH86_18385 [Acidimicrobiaceae bacterium]|nr:hypothetical protein [Acidimicrobiaceae bacterium]